MTLQNEKTQLELTKAKLQDTILEVGKDLHTKDLRISQLEYSARLAEEKATYENELRFRDLAHEHEENINKLQGQYRAELESALERCKSEYKESWLEEHAALSSKFTKRERELTQLLENERLASKTSTEAMEQRLTRLESERSRSDMESHRLRQELSTYKSRYEALSCEMEVSKVCVCSDFMYFFGLKLTV